jgi:hypothetical protein
VGGVGSGREAAGTHTIQCIHAAMLPRKRDHLQSAVVHFELLNVLLLWPCMLYAPAYLGTLAGGPSLTLSWGMLCLSTARCVATFQPESCCSAPTCAHALPRDLQAVQRQGQQQQQCRPRGGVHGCCNTKTPFLQA